MFILVSSPLGFITGELDPIKAMLKVHVKYMW